MGVGRKLRTFNKDIKIIGVEPSSAESNQQGLVNQHEFCPEICKHYELDEMIKVEDKDAYDTARKLLLMEGLFVGISSGSAMWGAIQKTKTIDEGLIVTVFGDHGFKYLSTGLFG